MKDGGLSSGFMYTHSYLGTTKFQPMLGERGDDPVWLFEVAYDSPTIGINVDREQIHRYGKAGPGEHG